MSWTEFLNEADGHFEFAEPADERAIARAESALGLNLPGDLRGLLAETNGLRGGWGAGLVWPVERIAADNLLYRGAETFREAYMPFDNLLFFADSGNGDQVAFAVDADGVIRRGDVFVWSHEDDSRVRIAPTLRDYLGAWLVDLAAR